MSESSVYEAVVVCDDADLPFLERQSGTLDPVLRVLIDNGYHVCGEWDLVKECDMNDLANTGVLTMAGAARLRPRPLHAPSAWQLEQAMSVLLATKARLLDEDPDLMADDRLFGDMLEGESGDAMEVLDRIIRASIVAGSFAKEAKERADAIAERAARYKARAESLRGAAFAAMMALELPRIDRPDFTASVKQNPASVFIENDATVPDAFCRITRAPDKAAIAAALKAGDAVPGAALLPGIESLQVRTR